MERSFDKGKGRQNMRRFIILSAITVAFGALYPVAQAQQAGWTTWRGPDHNGIVADSNWNPQALSGEPRIRWRTAVGTGYSNVSIKDDRLFTMGNVDDQDSVICLDVSTGEEKWRHTYRCRRGSYAGPRATPILDGGLVYTMSREAQVFCLGETDGKVRWSRDLKKELRVGNAGSGSLRCLNFETGRERRWSVLM